MDDPQQPGRADLSELLAVLEETKLARPAHLVHAARYQECPEGAEPDRWSRSELYRFGWIDMAEAAGGYEAWAHEAEYRAGLLAAAKWAHDGTADEPRPR